MLFTLRKNGTTRFLFRFIAIGLPALLLSAGLRHCSFGQESDAPETQAVTPLAEVLLEAEQNNPQIQAARQGWKAAKQVPSQVSTLPDPQFNLQQVNVGSPRPFAGYTNSDFAYVGFGVSQDFPYPGKLRLKGRDRKTRCGRFAAAVRIRAPLCPRRSQSSLFPARLSLEDTRDS